MPRLGLLQAVWIACILSFLAGSAQAATACTYSLSPSSATWSAGDDPGSTFVTVNTQSGCPWTAVSNAPSWLIVSGGPVSGTGPGSFSYGWSNLNCGSHSSEIGAITVAGQTFTVT